MAWTAGNETGMCMGSGSVSAEERRQSPEFSRETPLRGVGCCMPGSRRLETSPERWLRLGDAAEEARC